MRGMTASSPHLTGSQRLLCLQATYLFDAASGEDTISTFNDGIDLIELRATGATSFANLTVSGEVNFADISFGLDSIHIAGLGLANFSAADVIFS